MLSHFRLSHETEVEHIIYILSSDWGVFFVFSPFPVIATLQAHGEVYKYERRVSMYDFFFSPFQAQRACQSFIAEIFQELLSSIFLFPYLTGVENNYVPPIHKDGKK